MSGWYSYESKNTVTGATIYVSVTEVDAINTTLSLRPGLSDFAALEAFISSHKARKVRAPAYLAVQAPGAVLKAHIDDLGANGLAIFAAQSGIKENDLTRMTIDRDAIMPKHVLKRIGLRRDMATYPLNVTP